jgi:hypothetical protein
MTLGVTLRAPVTSGGGGDVPGLYRELFSLEEKNV